MSKHAKQYRVKMPAHEHPIYPDDCRRISFMMFRKWGIDISLHEAASIWKDYSDGFCSSWLLLPDKDEELADALEFFVEEV